MTNAQTHQEIADQLSIKLEVMLISGELVYQMTFQNSSEQSVWIPLEEPPGFRFDKENKHVYASFGYFEDIFGDYRGRYMIPKTKEVKPGAQVSWNLKDPIFFRYYFDEFTASARIRTALIPIQTSNIRGGQDLDGYLKNSVAIESSKISEK